MECTFEVVLYDAKHWWNIFDVFDPLPHQGIGIRYDEDHFLVWTTHSIFKIKAKKLAKRITWREEKEVSCRQKLIGKIWLDHCLIYHQGFDSGKEFLSRYVSIMNGVKSGK